MADATDFSNLSTNSFPWFRLPISLERTLEPWEDSVMPTFEAGSFDGSGVWAEVLWRVADDRTLEGDEWVQVRFDFELDDGTVGSYTAQPFVWKTTTGPKFRSPTRRFSRMRNSLKWW